MSTYEQQLKAEFDRISGQVTAVGENLRQECDARLHAMEQELVARRHGPIGVTPHGALDLSPITQSNQYRELAAGRLRNARFELPGGIRAAATSSSNWSAPVDRDAVVGEMPRRRRIRELLTVRRTSSGSVEFVKSTHTGNPAPQTETMQKAQVSMSGDLTTVTVRTIAGFVEASRQILADEAVLRDTVETTLRNALADQEDLQLLMGAGSAPNLDGLYTNATDASFALVTADTVADKLRKACQQVADARGVPTAIIVPTAILSELELLKDTTGRYVLNMQLGPDFGAARIWRTPIIGAPDMADDTYLVGDFANAATMYERQGVIVEIGYTGSQFTQNMVTILAEERVALAIKRSDLLVKGTL
jgi:HK97 family phage major capsid protein